MACVKAPSKGGGCGLWFVVCGGLWWLSLPNLLLIPHAPIGDQLPLRRSCRMTTSPVSIGPAPGHRGSACPTWVQPGGVDPVGLFLPEPIAIAAAYRH
jgi:hypothetical protein